MRSQSGTIAVAVLLLLLLTAASTGVEAELQSAGESSGVSTLPPGAEQPRRVVKRAPTSSFIGMRGKKDDERDTESSDITDGNWLGNGPDPLDYADLDTYYSENGRRLKKAPLAFVGMRGKKFIPMSVRLSGVLQHMEEERLREGLLQDFLNSLTDVNGAGDVEKRAPTGFNGMRGKRPALNGDEGEEEEAMELLQKRAPINSFVGMRGKKDVSHQHYKRAALSEAYDVRGKKQRFADFNNKFVAVRGKKSEQDGDGTGNWEAIGQQQYLVHPWLNVWGDKRAPNGFLGMRGKRPALFE
ncbi:tachykinins isoform X2 [Drosophila bipectinata]|uniref:tachykinins isoform X2 n=1 Tax=Drosophila bipectinata TaxID=42026 RepID=UPI001C8A73E6|nr:tachykinins isoform X2 [Drosophila bipectinata]